MLKKIFDFIMGNNQIENYETYRYISIYLEHAVDHSDYNKLIEFVNSLGIEKLPSRWNAKDIQGYESNSFYQHLEVNASVGNCDLIEKFVETLPRLSKEQSRKNEDQSDRLLSRGATMPNKFR
jgi:hypothetical protein